MREMSLQAVNKSDSPKAKKPLGIPRSSSISIRNSLTLTRSVGKALQEVINGKDPNASSVAEAQANQAGQPAPLSKSTSRRLSAMTFTHPNATAPTAAAKVEKEKPTKGSDSEREKRVTTPSGAAPSKPAKGSPQKPTVQTVSLNSPKGAGPTHARRPSSSISSNSPTSTRRGGAPFGLASKDSTRLSKSPPPLPLPPAAEKAAREAIENAAPRPQPPPKTRQKGLLAPPKQFFSPLRRKRRSAVDLDEDATDDTPTNTTEKGARPISPIPKRAVGRLSLFGNSSENAASSKAAKAEKDKAEKVKASAISPVKSKLVKAPPVQSTPPPKSKSAGSAIPASPSTPIATRPRTSSTTTRSALTTPAPPRSRTTSMTKPPAPGSAGPATSTPPATARSRTTSITKPPTATSSPLTTRSRTTSTTNRTAAGSAATLPGLSSSTTSSPYTRTRTISSISTGASRKGIPTALSPTAAVAASNIRITKTPDSPARATKNGSEQSLSASTSSSSPSKKRTTQNPAALPTKMTFPTPVRKTSSRSMHTSTRKAPALPEETSMDSIDANDVSALLELNSVLSPEKPILGSVMRPSTSKRGQTKAYNTLGLGVPQTPSRGSSQNLLPTRASLSYLSPDPPTRIASDSTVGSGASSPRQSFLRPNGNDRGSILSWEQLAAYRADIDVDGMLSHVAFPGSGAGTPAIGTTTLGARDRVDSGWGGPDSPFLFHDSAGSPLMRSSLLGVTGMGNNSIGGTPGIGTPSIGQVLFPAAADAPETEEGKESDQSALVTLLRLQLASAEVRAAEATEQAMFLNVQLREAQAQMKRDGRDLSSNGTPSTNVSSPLPPSQPLPNPTATTADKERDNERIELLEELVRARSEEIVRLESVVRDVEHNTAIEREAMEAQVADLEEQVALGLKRIADERAGAKSEAEEEAARREAELEEHMKKRLEALERAAMAMRRQVLVERQERAVEKVAGSWDAVVDIANQEMEMIDGFREVLGCVLGVVERELEVAVMVESPESAELDLY